MFLNNFETEYTMMNQSFIKDFSQDCFLEQPTFWQEVGNNTAAKLNLYENGTMAKVDKKADHIKDKISLLHEWRIV